MQGSLLYKFFKFGAFAIVQEEFIGKNHDGANTPTFLGLPGTKTTGQIQKHLGGAKIVRMQSLVHGGVRVC